MCNAHYARYRRSGSPLGSQVMRDSKPALCSVDGCKNRYMARGLCKTHWERMKRKGTLVAKFKRPSGHGTIKEGYFVFVRHVNGRKVRIRRCREVMETKIGRKLLPNETVHHKNGNKTDDRPSNLELWCSRHPKGQRIEDLLEHARVIIETYGSMNLSNDQTVRPEAVGLDSD
jgi:hypothetical protein